MNLFVLVALISCECNLSFYQRHFKTKVRMKPALTEDKVQHSVLVVLYMLLLQRKSICCSQTQHIFFISAVKPRHKTDYIYKISLGMWPVKLLAPHGCSLL